MLRLTGYRPCHRKVVTPVIIAALPTPHPISSHLEGTRQLCTVNITNTITKTSGRTYPPYWETAQSGLRPDLALNHAIKEHQQNYFAKVIAKLHNIYIGVCMLSTSCHGWSCSACASCLPPKYGLGWRWVDPFPVKLCLRKLLGPAYRKGEKGGRAHRSTYLVYLPRLLSHNSTMLM